MGVLRFLSDNSQRLPTIIEKSNLISAMQKAGFDSDSTRLVNQTGKDKEVTSAIANHFYSLLESPYNKKLLLPLKDLRDKKLAHNELVKIGDELTE